MKPPASPAADASVSVDAVLAALVEMRTATEEALAALQRGEPETAHVALGRGATASARLGRMQLRWESTPPSVAEQVRAVRTLQAVALSQAEQGKAEVARELEALRDHERGLKSYRPLEAAAPFVDWQS